MAEVRLTPDELDAIAQRVADLLAERQVGDAAAPAQPDRLTVAEAAALARVTPSTVYRWLSEQKLTRHGSIGRVLIDRAELDALLRSGPPHRPRRAAQPRFSRPAQLRDRPAERRFARAARGRNAV